MNCEWVKNNLTLYAFDELGDAERIEVEQHLSRCAECARAAGAEQVLRRILDLRPKLEPSVALLSECRSALSDALEDLPAPSRPRSPFDQRAPRVVAAEAGTHHFDWMAWLRAPFAGLNVQWHAGMAVALLSVGFVAGSFVAARRIVPLIGGATESGEVQAASISNIHSITPRSDGALDISVDTTRRQTITGRPDDPQVRDVLVFALSAFPNSGIRMDSIDLVKGRGQDQQIRAGLVAALRRDDNTGVRLKVMEALAAFGSDPAVRSALLEVLFSDRNPGVRIKAIEMLSSLRDPASVSALQRLAEGDPNQYIRQKSAKKLREWNAPVETY